MRPGRISKVFEFHNANSQTLKQMFSSFYPESTSKEVSSFVKQIEPGSRKVSMAGIQEFFITNRKRTATEALSDLKPELYKKQELDSIFN